MTRLPQPGVATPDRGPAPRGPAGRDAVPSTLRSPSPTPRHVPGPCGSARPGCPLPAPPPPPRTRGRKSPRARGTPRPHRGPPRAPRSRCGALPAQPPTNRYVPRGARSVLVTRRRGPQLLGAPGPARVPCRRRRRRCRRVRWLRHPHGGPVTSLLATLSGGAGAAAL